MENSTTPSKTNMELKMDPWKRRFRIWKPQHFQVPVVFGGVTHQVIFCRHFSGDLLDIVMLRSISRFGLL